MTNISWPTAPSPSTSELDPPFEQQLQFIKFFSKIPNSKSKGQEKKGLKTKEQIKDKPRDVENIDLHIQPLVPLRFCGADL